MTVYVDDYHRFAGGQYGRRRISMMIASSSAELHRMAELIGHPRRWQEAEAYDVGLAQRRAAIRAGAIAITVRQCVAMRHVARATGTMPVPADAEDALRWLVGDEAAERLLSRAGAI